MQIKIPYHVRAHALAHFRADVRTPLIRAEVSYEEVKKAHASLVMHSNHLDDNSTMYNAWGGDLAFNWVKSVILKVEGVSKGSFSAALYRLEDADFEDTPHQYCSEHPDVVFALNNLIKALSKKRRDAFYPEAVLSNIQTTLDLVKEVADDPDFHEDDTWDDVDIQNLKKMFKQERKAKASPAPLLRQCLLATRGQWKDIDLAVVSKYAKQKSGLALALSSVIEKRMNAVHDLRDTPREDV